MKKKWSPKVQMRDPRSLIPYVKNAKIHSKTQINKIAGAISEFGFTQPIVIDKAGIIIAGHGRREAAIALNLKEVPIVIADHLDEYQVMAARIADNKVSEAPFDLEFLKFDLGTLKLKDFKLDLTGFDLPQIEELLSGGELKPEIFDATNRQEPSPVITNEVKGKTEDDSIPEKIESKTKLGDIYSLGEHRLMCGDSTSIDAVERLMAGQKADMVFTDPPYGISLDTDYRRTKPKGSKPEEFTRPINSFASIEGDDRPFDASCIVDQFLKARDVFIFGANNFLHTIENYHKGSWICWDRTGGATNLDKMLGSTFELCWSRERHKYQIARVTWKGVCGHSKIDDGAKKVHPSMKPVALAEWFFERWGQANDNVVDLFGGSGSTLIACEKTNRKCFMMEIDPHYCDVIVARWCKYTGKKAILHNA